jgi:hypothetical protein
VLAAYTQIDKVWLSTNESVELEVEELCFSVSGQPSVVCEVHGIDGVVKNQIRALVDQALEEKRSARLSPECHGA